MSRVFRVVGLFIALSICSSVVHADEKKGGFQVEIIKAREFKPGEEIFLTLDGFTTSRGNPVISDKVIKENYCAPKKSKDGKKLECVIFVFVERNERDTMTVEHLLKHIEKLRKLRDSKADTYVYVIL